MKKLLVLFLALIMVLSLAACGGNENSNTPSGSSTTDPGTSQETPTTSIGGDTSKNDLTTESGFLAAFGLTEDDMKCANFTRIEKTSYNLETNVIGEVGAYISAALTDDEVETWLTKIIGKLNSLSDDGKITALYTGADGAALTVDYIMGKTMKIAPGSYTYNGKQVSVIISVYPNSLDDADPNEAMAACLVDLEFR